MATPRNLAQELNAMKNTLHKEILLAASLAAMLIVSPVSTATAAENDGRFTMTPTDDGFLRLDSQSGAVSLCARSSNGWSCKPVDNDHLASHDKMAALAKENDVLKREVDELRRALDSQIGNGARKGLGPKGFKIPSDEDVDKFMTFLERLARKFRGMVNDLKENQQPGTPL